MIRSAVIRKGFNARQQWEFLISSRHEIRHLRRRTQSGTSGNDTSSSRSSFSTPITSFAIGSLAGLLGSLAGMGGGFVMIPLMTTRHLGLRLTQHQAHGTSLFAVAATGAAGAISYSFGSAGAEGDSQKNVVHYPEAAAIALTAMITVRWGAQATLAISGRTLQQALGVLMLVMAPAVPAKAYYVQHLHQPEKTSQLVTDSPSGVFTLDRMVYPALIGVGSGFLAGFFGVGGGTIVVPALTVFTNLSHHEALGTSLAAMTLPALTGTLSHYRAGNCSLRVAPFLATGALVGAFLGAKLSLQTDEDILRWGFSMLLAVLGARTLIKV